MLEPAPMALTQTIDSPPVCPWCDGPGARVFTARDRNREVSDRPFPYAACQRCDTVFLIDIPEDLGRYYAEAGDYYGFGRDGEPRWSHDVALQQAERFRIDLIRFQVEPGPLIEVGAGSGGFAAAAVGAGFSVTVVEMDTACCRYLSDRLGIRVIQSAVPDRTVPGLGPARVGAIWHVLEHLPRPRQAFEALAREVEPDGLLALAVPNRRSLQFRLLGSRWAHLDAPRHLSLIPAEQLIERAREMGFRLIASTTTDPAGLQCNDLGWMLAWRRRPATGRRAFGEALLAPATARVMRRFERGRDLGAAIMLIFRRAGPSSA